MTLMSSDEVNRHMSIDDKNDHSVGLLVQQGQLGVDAAYVQVHCFLLVLVDLLLEPRLVLQLPSPPHHLRVLLLDAEGTVPQHLLPLLRLVLFLQL